MHLVRCLFFVEARYQFDLIPAHIPGEINTLADNLSCNRRSSFLSKAPHMDTEPTPIPPQLPELLAGPSDWTSLHWTKQFASIVTRV